MTNDTELDALLTRLRQPGPYEGRAGDGRALCAAVDTLRAERTEARTAWSNACDDATMFQRRADRAEKELDEARIVNKGLLKQLDELQANLHSQAVLGEEIRLTQIQRDEARGALALAERQRDSALDVAARNGVVTEAAKTQRDRAEAGAVFNVRALAAAKSEAARLEAKLDAVEREFTDWRNASILESDGLRADVAGLREELTNTEKFLDDFKEDAKKLLAALAATEPEVCATCGGMRLIPTRLLPTETGGRVMTFCPDCAKEKP